MIIIKHETVDDNSSRHDKSASNLNFTRFGSKKKEAVPTKSAGIRGRMFQDIHTDQVNRADSDQSIVQDIERRVQNKQAVHAPTKFQNFSRPLQFTSPGDGTGHHTSNGADK